VAIIAVYLGISSVILKSGILISAVNLFNVIRRNVIVIILINKVFDLNLVIKRFNY